MVTEKVPGKNSNISRVAQTIREHAEQFSLWDWVDHINGVPDDGQYAIPSPLQDCGTICCICGFANALANTRCVLGTGINYADMLAAARFMGLPYSFARALFIPPIFSGESVPSDISNPKNPWRQAAALELIPEDENIYKLPAGTIANVLDAIADGRIEVCELPRAE